MTTSRALFAWLIAAVLVAMLAIPACSELQLGDETVNPALGLAAENTPILCTDGVDNDDDGFIDCADDDCTDRGIPTDAECREAPCPGRVVCLTTEDTDKLCNDGVDNDGNGFTDCGDFGCSRSPNVTICCQPTGTEDSDAACDDGLDNDCNGFTDCDDFGCLRNENVSVCCQRTGEEDNDEACLDGLDNDCNGYTDCGDFGCSQNPMVTVCGVQGPSVPEDDEMLCSDGVDNDRDGRIDCGDWDCAPPNGPSDFDYCRQATPENDGDSCSDGVDNDRDGHVDCDDYDCWQNAPAVCGA